QSPAGQPAQRLGVATEQRDSKPRRARGRGGRAGGEVRRHPGAAAAKLGRLSGASADDRVLGPSRQPSPRPDPLLARPKTRLAHRTPGSVKNDEAPTLPSPASRGGTGRGQLSEGDGYLFR